MNTLLTSMPSRAFLENSFTYYLSENKLAYSPFSLLVPIPSTPCVRLIKAGFENEHISNNPGQMIYNSEDKADCK